MNARLRASFTNPGIAEPNAFRFRTPHAQTFERILIALLFAVGCAPAQTVPATYNLRAGGGSFNFTNVSLSKSDAAVPVLFTATVQNDTGANWKKVQFEIHFRAVGGGETVLKGTPQGKGEFEVFHSLSTREIRIHVPNSEASDTSTISEYKIAVLGQIEKLVQRLGIYSGPVVEDDCLGSLSQAMAAPEGIERRRKLMELMTLGCMKPVEEFTIMMYPHIAPAKTIGPENNRHEYEKAALRGEHGVAYGWIDRALVHPSAEMEYVDYVEAPPAPNFKELQRQRAQTNGPNAQ